MTADIITAVSLLVAYLGIAAILIYLGRPRP